MDFTQQNDPITISHFEWLGFKNVNGALYKEGFKGEIQFYDNVFWFCQDGKAVSKITSEKDINDIYMKQKYGR